MPMQIPKPTPSARALFESLVPEDERVQVKPMFGNLGAFVNGNMFMGIFGPDVGVKLQDADERALRELVSGAKPGWKSVSALVIVEVRLVMVMVLIALSPGRLGNH